MEKRKKIRQYRERLDKTLASPDLTTDESIKALVSNQLLRSKHKIEGCSENVIEKRAAEVSYFLDMLRSTSSHDNESCRASEMGQPEWKMKQDDEEFRVMYREGPKGTPFHTLLVEGFVDGPIDVCLCSSWESELYKKWWPQFTLPAFKVLSSRCLQKVRIGEQISLVRVKVSWPLSTREIIVHYFLFEYFQDDLIVVLLNSISDLDSIDMTTHGFSRDGIPDPEDVVRIDVVGGYAIHKVTENRSYFRTIASMDMKLDFVPPSLINFVSRQLIGSGFKLYQKVVASTFKSDSDFSKALKDPLYTYINEALYGRNQQVKLLEENELSDRIDQAAAVNRFQEELQEYSAEYEKVQENSAEYENLQENLTEYEKVQEHSTEDPRVQENSTEDQKVQENFTEDKKVQENSTEDQKVQENSTEDQKVQENSTEDQKVRDIDDANEPAKAAVEINKTKAWGEIEEEESEESRHVDEEDRYKDDGLGKRFAEKCDSKAQRISIISPEVEKALQTLDKVINVMRQCRLNTEAKAASCLSDEKRPEIENGIRKNLKTSDNSNVHLKVELSSSVSTKEIMERASDELARTSSTHSSRHVGSSNSLSKEVNHNKIVPASPEQKISSLGPAEVTHRTSSSTKLGTTENSGPNQKPHDLDKQPIPERNGIVDAISHVARERSISNRINRYWCFPGSPIRLKKVRS